MRSQKKTRFFSLGRKWVFTLALFLLVFAAASVVKVRAASKIMGWLGGWSEDGNIGGSFGWPPDGNETGVGWISMNNTNPGAGGLKEYNVTIDNSGKVSGYAWANASNTPNSSTSQAENGLGWVDFNPQNHCTTGTPDSAKQQYKAASCTPSADTGCSSVGVMRSGDDLTGCARFVSIAQASASSNSGGWQGWLKMKDVKVDTSVTPNKLKGYAWNGEEAGTGSNMANGLGWISFNKATIEEVCTLAFIPSTQKLINEKVNDTVQLEEVGTNCACRNVKIENINTSIIDTLSPTTFPFFATNPTKDTANITIKTKEVASDTPFDGVAKATSDNCGEAMLNLLVRNVPVCTLTCPSEIVVTTGQTKSVKSEIGITGEAGCTASAISCTEAGPDKNGNINVTTSCDVSATGDLRYGSSKLQAVAGSGPSNSCTSPITVKGPGWAEVSP